MIRRSFRIGLTLGLLAGLAFALAKMLGSRPAPEAAAPAPTQPWPRLTTDPAEPARPSRSLQLDPDAPAPRFPAASTSAPTADPAPAPAAPPAAVAPPPAPIANTPTATEPPARKAQAAKATAKQPASAKAPAKQPATKAPAKQPATKATAAKKAAKKKPLVAPWVEPSGDVCPTSHPVKGKLASKIFHLPGMLNYDRTKPDRCYRDVTAAETDGLRPAKR